MIVAAKIAQRVSGKQAGTTAATRWLPISRSFVSRSEVVDFGKHKGLTFAEILQKETGYCQWVVSILANEQTSPDALLPLVPMMPSRRSGMSF